MARTRFVLGLLVLPGGLALTVATADGGHRLLGAAIAPGGDPAAAVAGLAALLASLIAAWLTLCLALALAAELPGATGAMARRLRDRVTPVVVRRWASIVLGASVTATFVPGTAVSAVRATGAQPAAGPTDAPPVPSPGWTPGSTTRSTPGPTSLPGPGFTPPPGRTAVSGPGWSAPGAPPTARSATAAPPAGWVPRRPAARQRTDPHLLTGRQRTPDADESVVVRRGDTLWSIAAARLGPDATDAEITRAWPRWHAANATVIGSDPHTLLPGMLLTPPTTD